MKTLRAVAVGLALLVVLVVAAKIAWGLFVFLLGNLLAIAVGVVIGYAFGKST